jgi:hypothetical protein
VSSLETAVLRLTKYTDRVRCKRISFVLSASGWRNPLREIGRADVIEVAIHSTEAEETDGHFPGETYHSLERVQGEVIVDSDVIPVVFLILHATIVQRTDII